MSKTLWIFGDSLSWDHKIRIKNKKVSDTDLVLKYINEFLDGNVFDSWGEIVSKELGYQYINHAAFQTDVTLEFMDCVNSNNANINLLNKFSSKFKKGDIVILGFTEMTRIEYGKDNFGVGFSVNHDLNETNSFLAPLLVNINENLDFYVMDMLQKLKGIEYLSDVVGFDLWYWSWQKEMDEIVKQKNLPLDRWVFRRAYDNYTNYGSLISQNGGGSIEWETNNTIMDGHLGKIGNEIHADILLKFFKKQIYK